MDNPRIIAITAATALNDHVENDYLYGLDEAGNVWFTASESLATAQWRMWIPHDLERRE